MQGLDGRKWRQIIIMNEMSIFTPEAESVLCETLELRKQTSVKKLVKNLERILTLVQQWFMEVRYVMY